MRRAAVGALALGALVLAGPRAAIAHDEPPGQPIPAYRWVTPPAALASGTPPPAGATITVRLAVTGSEVVNPATPDGQAIVILPPGSFPPSPGESAVRVTIRAVDPSSLGAPPPGRTYAGNAYTFAGSYQKSGRSAPLAADVCPSGPSKPPGTRCLTIVLRYAVPGPEPRAGEEGAGAGLFRWEAGAWSPVEATDTHDSRQVYGESPRLGTFVAALPRAQPRKPGSSVPIVLAIALAALALASVGGFARARVRRRALRRRPAAKRVRR